MKISKIIIPAYRQFKNFELDLTYPEGHPKAGQPLDKVCLIGRNGTGKSTLLEMINLFLGEKEHFLPFGLFIFEIVVKSTKFYSIHGNHYQFYLKEQINQETDWVEKLGENGNGIAVFLTQYETYIYKEDEKNSPTFPHNKTELLMYSPAESSENVLLSIEDVPATHLDNAHKLRHNFPTKHLISNQTIAQFWEILMFHIAAKEIQFTTFSKQNKDKTYRELEKEFDHIYPNILPHITHIWDKILANLGLYWDYEKAEIPFLPTENFKVYIKSIGEEELIPYNRLSTGVRNFLFRLGHIASLFFNYSSNASFLLVDEPENSLFPTIKLQLIAIYEEIIKDKNCQFFVATHDPIIAAQFEPEERIFLDFNAENKVSVESIHKGQMPEGDDPNDILRWDFGMPTLYGKAALIKWERFQNLAQLIEKEEDKENKNKLISEYLAIGTLYNFPVKE